MTTIPEHGPQLLTDLQQIQTIINDLSSRISDPGIVTSWLFPNKPSSQISLQQLLTYIDDSWESQAIIARVQSLPTTIFKASPVQSCSSSSNTEECTMYYKLLEALIDRLVFFMQLLAVYATEIIALLSNETLPQLNHHTSLGIAAKTCWTRLHRVHKVALASGFQRSSSLTPPNTKNVKWRSCVSESSLKKSSDTSCIGCQTETKSLTSCASCQMSQDALKQLGIVLVDLCEKQNIPSFVQKCRSDLSANIDSVTHWEAVMRWISAMKDDIRQLVDKEIEYFELNEESKKKMLELEDEVSLLTEKFKAQIQTETELKKELELSLRDANGLYEEAVCKLKQLEEEMTKKEELMLNLRNSHKQEISTIKESSKARIDALIEEKLGILTENQDLNERLKSKFKAVQKLKSQLKEQEDVDSTKMKLQLEVDSLSLQVKTLEANLTEETRMKIDAQYNAETAVKNKIELEKKVKLLELELNVHKEQRRTLEQKTESICEKCKEYETLLKQYHEREVLLVQYPDLNGPIREKSGDLDPVADMEEQYKANLTRIDLLKWQNEALRRSLAKYKKP